MSGVAVAKYILYHSNCGGHTCCLKLLLSFFSLQLNGLLVEEITHLRSDAEEAAAIWLAA